MGGGDLNLKKSWHPKTLKNVERVWKAEQQHDAEQKKISQLQKELAEERCAQEIRQVGEKSGVLKTKRTGIEWMYQGAIGMVKREDYLLGRPIDKTFELVFRGRSDNVTADEKDDVPETSTPEEVVVDLANKIREDPLFLMRRIEDKKIRQQQLRVHKMKTILRLESEERKSERRGKRNEERSIKKHDSGERNRDYHRSSGKRRGRRDYDRSTYSRVSYRYDSPDRIRIKEEPRSRSPSSRPTKRRKLTTEEMEAKRQQMADNAKWREDERNKTTQLRVKRERVEKVEDERSEAAGPEFLNPLWNDAISCSSVESHVRSNVNRVQRGCNYMERNFARK